MGAFAELPMPIFAGGAFLFGLVVGSFLNVVIHRLPRGESLLHPGSHCPACNASIAPWDNVPLLAYLWLGGRCRGCRARIALRYPLVELLTGLVFAAIAFRYGPSAVALVWLGFAAAMIAAAAIDFDHRIIPDEISLGGLLVALAAVPAAQWADGMPYGDALQRSALGALLGAGALWSVGFAHARIASALGRRFDHWPGEGESEPRPGNLDYWIWFPGVGFGDVKLLAMIGAVVGPVGALETILAASLVGLVLGVVWAAATRQWSTPFGFAPALAAGALLVALSPVHLIPAH
ncbi:MAG TPA: prepilin peptidase [Myxococcota bacterium]|jgi:leader peptidase (prepilin peptidase)/N-methyltransferase